MTDTRRWTICMMYQDEVSQASSVMKRPRVEGKGELSSNPMNPAKTPNGGSPIAANANNESSTAYCGMPDANPLTACGSMSSPYLVRTTCHAIKSPLVARPTVPTIRAARGVAVRVAATNHQSIEKNERLP